MLIIDSRYLNKYYIYLIYNNCADVFLYLKKKENYIEKLGLKRRLNI